MSIALFLVLANLLCGEFSVTGRRLALSQHPFILRLRWLGIGMVLALFISGYRWEETSWAGWVAVGILLISSVRHFASTPDRQAGTTDDSVSKPIA